eukprot:393012-Pyramimonas_sp.AAC.1
MREPGHRNSKAADRAPDSVFGISWAPNTELGVNRMLSRGYGGDAWSENNNIHQRSPPLVRSTLERDDDVRRVMVLVIVMLTTPTL